MGVARHQQQRLHLRPHQRSARGERVGRGSGGGGAQHAVAAERRHRPPVDLEHHLKDPLARRLLDRGLVQRPGAGQDVAVAPGDRVDRHPLFDGVVAAGDGVDSACDELLLRLREEPVVAEVDAEQRHTGGPGQLGGPQHRAVAAEDQHDLGALGAPRPPLDDPRPEVLRQVGGRRPRPTPPRWPATGCRAWPAEPRPRRRCAGWSGAPRAGRPAPRASRRPLSTAWDKASSPTSLAVATQARKNSTLPDGPGNGLATAPASRRPSPRAAATTSRNAASRNAGSRTTPPAPNRCLPTSNCGFTIGSSTPSVHAASAGSTVRSEMNDRSATVSWAGPPISAGVSARTLVRSCTRTRASLRNRQTSCP